MTVLWCRQTGRGTDLVNSIEESGGTVVRLPLIEVVPPTDGGVGLAAALERLDRYDWLACTSVNGVEALTGTVLPVGLRLAAVGPATAEAFVQVLGRSALVVPGIHTAAALARGFPKRAGRVLAPLAELASNDLADGLAERGYETDVVVAYATRTPDLDQLQRSAAREADVVILSAPSVAHRLVEVLGELAPLRAVAIGPRSAEAGRELGLEVLETTPDGVLAALESLA